MVVSESSIEQSAFALRRRLVRKGGLEPPRYCYRQPLKLVRLPIPPLPRGGQAPVEGCPTITWPVLVSARVPVVPERAWQVPKLQARQSALVHVRRPPSPRRRHPSARRFRGRARRR